MKWAGVAAFILGTLLLSTIKPDDGKPYALFAALALMAFGAVGFLAGL